MIFVSIFRAVFHGTKLLIVREKEGCCRSWILLRISEAEDFSTVVGMETHDLAVTLKAPGKLWRTRRYVIMPHYSHSYVQCKYIHV